jgi:uncharacterized protein (DUF2141 family)
MRTIPLLAAIAIGLTASPVCAADLDVDIEAISTQRGHVVVFVFDSEAAWDTQRAPVRRERLPPDGDARLHVRLTGLAPGDYAVMVLHDTNANGRFDTGPFGIPKDDYGFSNDPVVFAKPAFARVRFTLPAAGTRIRVPMH